jgi:hypothetical protein
MPRSRLRYFVALLSPLVAAGTSSSGCSSSDNTKTEVDAGKDSSTAQDSSPPMGMDSSVSIDSSLPLDDSGPEIDSSPEDSGPEDSGLEVDSSPGTDADEDAGPALTFPGPCPAGSVYSETWAADPVASGTWIPLTFNGATPTYTYNTNHTVSLLQGNPNSQMWIGPHASWSNYTVSVSLRIDSASGNAGINFRMEDELNPAPNDSGHMYYIGILTTGVQVGLETGGAASSFTQLASTTGTFSVGTFYTLVVSMSGSTMNVSVGGTSYVSGLVNATETFGGVGLRTYQSGATYGAITVTCN